jgi:Glycogen recognition site of AMP-activated protein kinase
MDMAHSTPFPALRRGALMALVLAAAAATARAQQVRSAVSLAGGTATDQRGVRSSAATISPSVLIVPDPRLSVGLSGTATRFQGSDWSAGGTASAGTRLPLGGGLSLAASASYAATRTSFGATYLLGEATPTLEASVRRLTLFGGAHLARGESSLTEGTANPGGLFTPPTAGSNTVRASRTSTGPVYGALLALPSARPDAGGTLSYREERARVSGIAVVDREAGASWGSSALALSATAGARAAVDERTRYGSVSATVALSRSVAVQSAVGSYASSRVLGTPGGRFATLGLSLHGTSSSGGRAPESVRGTPPVPAGATRLVLRAPRASRVELAGEWSEWATIPATRGGDGLWYADVRLPTGAYRYAFKVDGARWAVPEGAPTVDDGFGGKSALLTVQ